METTDTQFLPYPEANDPGAAALQLQVLAEAIDAQLTDAFSTFRTVVNPDVLVLRLSANQTGILLNTTTVIDFDQVLYDTTGAGLSASFLSTGYFRIGSYILSNPSGGVTANSSRRTFMRYERTIFVPAVTVVQEFFDSTTLDAGVGGEIQSVEALIRVPSIDAPGPFIITQFLHLNAASTMNVLAGSLMWYYKVCELED